MSYGVNKYKQASVMTATPGQILIMLYEAAIKHTKRAIEGIEKNDLKLKAHGIGKAHDIVNELLNSLNYEVGGQVARELEKLYNYSVEQLLKANIQSTTEELKAVVKILENLLEGWKVAVAQVQKRASGEGPKP